MIEFNNVSMTYNTGIQALKNVSFQVSDGEFVFIIGLSGSGKSTLIKLLTCEENPTQGHVYIDDFEISFMRKDFVPFLRRNIGMVFQDFRLIYSKTVYENVAFAMEIVGAERQHIRKRVPIVLNAVGLRDKASMKANQLSGGEQQRVSIARAMVNNPTLILADEPTGNLDPVNSEAIMELLEEINENGTTVVVCTHESSIVNRMKRRVIEISDGVLVRDEQIGEYNLEGSSDNMNPRHMVSRPRKNCEPKAKGRASSTDGTPLVRNINMKFNQLDEIGGLDQSENICTEDDIDNSESASENLETKNEKVDSVVNIRRLGLVTDEEQANKAKSIDNETPSFFDDLNVRKPVLKFDTMEQTEEPDISDMTTRNPVLKIDTMEHTEEPDIGDTTVRKTVLKFDTIEQIEESDFGDTTIRKPVQSIEENVSRTIADMPQVGDTSGETISGLEHDELLGTIAKYYEKKTEEYNKRSAK